MFYGLLYRRNGFDEADSSSLSFFSIFLLFFIIFFSECRSARTIIIEVLILRYIRIATFSKFLRCKTLSFRVLLPSKLEQLVLFGA